MFTIDSRSCGCSLKEIKRVASKLTKRIHELHHVVDLRAYTDDAASLVLPVDSGHVKAAMQYASQCRNTQLLVVIGIGGSNLGTKAVQEAVLGAHTTNRKVIYLDTIDPVTFSFAVKKIKERLLLGTVVINIVSKSGTTTETIANAALLDAIGKHKNLFVVVTSDPGSPLEMFARKRGYHSLRIPKQVGGRFSLFSAVGLFPLAVLGVDISRLVDGAHSMLRSCLRTDIATNPALMLASIAYLQVKKNKRVHDTFVFSPQLKSVAECYRQLLAESIGKSPSAGILPTVSVGSTDLHSVGQLDIAGPNSTYYRFISVKKQKDVSIPVWAASLVPGIGGKTFRQVLAAIRKGTQAAFTERKRPFIEIELPDLSAETIGGYLQVEMISMMLLATLLRVNAFDQPAVEAYKAATRRLLG